MVLEVNMWMELAVIFGIFAVGNILFGRFAADTPTKRRLLKLAVFSGITALIYLTVGRPWSLVWLVVPLVALIYVHGVWLPRHGINGWTGEPRDKYLELLGRKTQ
jgi:predicted MFS family arabinose efflux permease